MPPVLEVEAVRKSFGGVAAVSDVSLTLEPRRIYGLIGPNGSGKTTLFNCITGIERLDAGRVSFRGGRVRGPKPPQGPPPRLRRPFPPPPGFPGPAAPGNPRLGPRGAHPPGGRPR